MSIDFDNETSDAGSTPVEANDNNEGDEKDTHNYDSRPGLRKRALSEVPPTPQLSPAPPTHLRVLDPQHLDEGLL